MNATSLKYILIGISFFQFIIQSNYQPKLSLLIIMYFWIILLQIYWFHIHQTHSKQKLMPFIVILGLVFNYYSQMNIIFLWSLISFELLFNYNKVYAYGYELIILGFQLYCIFIEYHSFSLMLWLFELALVLSIMYLIKEQKNYQHLQMSYYDHVKVQSEYKDKQEILENHISLMKELYITKERNRISRDIHDSVGHVLSTIIIQLSALSSLAEQSHPQIHQMSNELAEFARKGLQEVRQIVHEMKPEKIKDLSLMIRLEEMIDAYQKMTKIHVVLNTNTPLWVLSELQEDIIYRVVQEFLGNTAKHAEANEIRILLHYLSNSIIITLKDDGKGTESITPHLGLMGIEERVIANGGKVSIKTAVGEGFMLRIVLNQEGE